MFRRYDTALFIFVCIIAGLLGACGGSRQLYQATTGADIKQMIDSSSWVFTVNQVIPVYGRARHPNGDYSVLYNAQKLEVYLPYFGRATSGVDVFTSRGPLDFSALNPAMEMQQVKAGEWQVLLRPDNREVQAMDFTFFANGRAYLEVRMTSRTAINYSGNIRPLRQSERK